MALSTPIRKLKPASIRYEHRNVARVSLHSISGRQHPIELSHQLRVAPEELTRHVQDPIYLDAVHPISMTAYLETPWPTPGSDECATHWQWHAPVFPCAPLQHVVEDPVLARPILHRDLQLSHELRRGVLCELRVGSCPDVVI